MWVASVLLRTAVLLAIQTGSSLASPTLGAEQAPAVESVTYAEHVAPILNANCVGCHRSGAVGPFSLATYEDVRRRVRAVANAVGRREMPPWKPTPGVGRFVGARGLTSDEIALIQNWAYGGVAEGDSDRLAAPPSWPDGWQRGTPDLVVTMPEPFTLAASGPDVYRSFVVPVAIPDARFVAAIELKPDTTPGLHHARILIAPSGSARRLDAVDIEAGYDDGLIDQARSPDGHFLGWAPGTLPNAPASLAWRLDPGTDLVIRAHLAPNGVAHDVRVSVGLFFADAPAAAAPVVVQLGSQTIDIPAGDPAYVVHDTYRLPVDVDVLAIYPHAHSLGRSIHVSAHLPDGTRRPLIQIDDWDFDWQEEYRYVEPVRLPGGSTVTMRYVFDNSDGNVNNPRQPPRRVRFGPRSTDEMAELMLQVLPVDPADRLRLIEHVEKKVRQIVLSGSEKQLADDPTSAVNQGRVGVNLVALGRVGEAVTHLRAAVRLDPDSAPAHYQLGTGLALEGAHGDAIASFRRALALRPNFVQAHNNLGGLLQLTGGLEEAAAEYRETLRLDPTHVSAHFNLGGILLDAARFVEAEARFRQALMLKPNSADGQTGLGRALAGQGRLDEAVDAHVAATRIDPGDAEAHRLLGDVRLRQGQLAEARASFDRARRLESSGRTIGR